MLGEHTIDVTWEPSIEVRLWKVMPLPKELKFPVKLEATLRALELLIKNGAIARIPAVSVTSPALCRIGDPRDEGPPLLLFQRSRADVGVSGVRRTIILPVRLTDPERRMHRLLDDYTSRVCREAEARRDTRARLAAIVLKKRALSSAASLAASARRRLLLIGAPILYVPLTIAWVLTNMRYTVTVQPLVFTFIAVALLAAADRRAS